MKPGSPVWPQLAACVFRCTHLSWDLSPPVRVLGPGAWQRVWTSVTSQGCCRLRARAKDRAWQGLRECVSFMEGLHTLPLPAPPLSLLMGNSASLSLYFPVCEMGKYCNHSQSGWGLSEVTKP